MDDRADELDEAIAILRDGGLVAFPTETVYGLGADALDGAAVRRLFAVKDRPVTHPVIVHLPAAPSGEDLLDPWAAAVSPAARTLADACWPGPLTLLLRRAPGVSDLLTGGLDSVGLRVPDQPLAQALLQGFGRGVAAPSANRFGRVSPTTAAHVRADLDGDVDLILDGGPCRVGVESTIVDCTTDEPIVVRAGAVPRERLEALLGRPLDTRSDGTIAAPGTLASHYAPAAEVVLVGADELTQRADALVNAGAHVGVLAPSPLPALPAEVERLEAPSDVETFAHELYALLRAADDRGVDVLLAVAPARRGLGAAVADRLTRAAHHAVPEGGGR